MESPKKYLNCDSIHKTRIHCLRFMYKSWKFKKKGSKQRLQVKIIVISSGKHGQEGTCKGASGWYTSVLECWLH